MTIKQNSRTSFRMFKKLWGNLKFIFFDGENPDKTPWSLEIRRLDGTIWVIMVDDMFIFPRSKIYTVNEVKYAIEE